MTLYEIDNGILECMDLETGEVVDVERLEDLQIERDLKIENVALGIKNLSAEIEAYKREKDTFAERERVARNKVEGLKKWLKYALDGEKFTTDRVEISFRASEKVEVLDEAAFVRWACENDRDDLLKYSAPCVDKAALKQAIKDGAKVDGAMIVVNRNIQIR